MLRTAYVCLPRPFFLQIVFAVCEGTCGSKHPGAAVIAEGYGNFTITA